jgi:CRISPR-associated endoribonuclease Cas6
LRIKIECPIRKAVTLPINYNYYLTGVIYNFLRQSDQNYASFLHQEGYRNQQKRFKLFTFSQLQARRRQIKGDQICFQSTVSWYISSPKDEFLTHLAGSLLAQTTDTTGKSRIGGQ